MRGSFGSRLHGLSNGGVHEVLHPECVAITKTRVVVIYPDEARVVPYGLIHVNSVEALQRA